MAQLTVQPIIRLTLSSEEFTLISKGLDSLERSDGSKLPSAQKLRDEMTRHRAQQSVGIAKSAHGVLGLLPPKGHDYGED